MINKNQQISNMLKKIFLFILALSTFTIYFNYAEATSNGCTGGKQCLDCFGDTCGSICSNPPSGSNCVNLGKKCCTQSTCDKVGPGYSCITDANNTYECLNEWYCLGGNNISCCKKKTQTVTPAPEGKNLFSGITCKDDVKDSNGNIIAHAGDCKIEDMIALAINATNMLLGAIASIALLFFIVAGVQMVISQGNSDKISSAKSMMLNSIIGIAIALCSFLIIVFIQKNILGMNTEVPNIIKSNSYKP